MPTDQSITSISSQQQTLSGLDPLRQKLQEELQRSILLEDAEKAYWLSQLPELPRLSIENLLKTLIPKNQVADMYIQTALSQDKQQEHLKSLQPKVKKIIQQAYQVEEKTEVKTAEKTEEDLLGQLDDL